MVDYLASVYANIRDFYDRTFWNWVDAVTEYGQGYVINYSGLRWLSGANQLWIDDPSVLTSRLLARLCGFFSPPSCGMERGDGSRSAAPITRKMFKLRLLYPLE